MHDNMKRFCRDVVGLTLDRLMWKFVKLLETSKLISCDKNVKTNYITYMHYNVYGAVAPLPDRATRWVSFNGGH